MSAYHIYGTCNPLKTERKYWKNVCKILSYTIHACVPNLFSRTTILITWNVLISKFIAIIINPGLNARRSTMSHIFLTRWIFQLLGLALLSWVFARIGVHRPFLRLPCLVFSIRSYLPLDLNRVSSFTADASPPIRSTLHFLTFQVSFQSLDWLWYPMVWFKEAETAGDNYLFIKVMYIGEMICP